MENSNVLAPITVNSSSASEILRVNVKMRGRRRSLGLSLRSLAELADVEVSDLQDVEKLRDVPGPLRQVAAKLHRIANVLEISFHELFSREYLDALQQSKAPQRRSPFDWTREIAWVQGRSLGLSPHDPTEAIEEQIDHAWLCRDLDAVLSGLPARERFVLEKRFGLDGQGSKTLEETGALLGVTATRVRQIEAKAKSRLRHPTRAVKLKPFL